MKRGADPKLGVDDQFTALYYAKTDKIKELLLARAPGLKAGTGCMIVMLLAGSVITGICTILVCCIIAW